MRESGSIGLGEGAYFRHGGIAEEHFSALGAYQGRESSRFGRGESVHDDIFYPIGMVTGKATVFGPFAWWVPGPFLESFLQPIRLVLLVQGAAPRRRAHAL